MRTLLEHLIATRGIEPTLTHHIAELEQAGSYKLTLNYSFSRADTLDGLALTIRISTLYAGTKPVATEMTILSGGRGNTFLDNDSDIMGALMQYI